MRSSQTGTATPLLSALALAAHRAARRVEAALGSRGPGLDQWRVLDLLADGEGRAMTAIAGAALVPAPTATKIVDRMIDGGLVYRRPDETDRRRVLVLASERGLALHRRLAPAVRAVEAELCAEIGGDVADLARRLGGLVG